MTTKTTLVRLLALAPPLCVLIPEPACRRVFPSPATQGKGNKATKKIGDICTQAIDTPV